MKHFVLLLYLCAPLRAIDITDWQIPSNKRLVEIIYIENHRRPFELNHTIVTFYLSELERGLHYESISNGIDMNSRGWSGGDIEAKDKAEECIRLLRSTNQPEDLPGSPSEIVIVRCAQGWIERRFPITRLPAAVREMLLVMGFRDEQFTHLAFSK